MSTTELLQKYYDLNLRLTSYESRYNELRNQRNVLMMLMNSASVIEANQLDQLEQFDVDLNSMFDENEREKRAFTEYGTQIANHLKRIRKPITAHLANPVKGVVEEFQFYLDPHTDSVRYHVYKLNEVR